MQALIAQLNPTIGDLDGNTRKILSTLLRAREKKIEVVVFPELSITGYPPSDFLFQESFIAATQKKLEEILPATKGMFVVVGLPRINPAKKEKPLHNSAAVIADGKLLGYYDKQLLPTYDVFDERRYFEPGHETKVWEYKGKKIAVVICEDMWQHAGLTDVAIYPKDPIEELIPLKPDLLINLSASPYHFQKSDTRTRVCAKGAETLKCPTILCCQVGGNDQLVFDGYSLYLSGNGELLGLAKGFEEDELIIDLNAPICPCPHEFDPWHDLYYAIVLGLRDYFEKSGFTKACLGLSGGIDSALVATIAADALGPKNVLGVTMPSCYSSKGSVDDSKKLAENLGIDYLCIPIEEAFSKYLDILSPHFAGKESDVTEENLQSRIRGMILMALSNKHGYVVLSTGNKSELALGYCTLYGDMCGGLGVISDVIKTHVYELCRWINREKEIIPQSILDKPPSAELRPDQRDTDSLPDYAIVDAVLRSYVEDYLSPTEVAEKHDLPLELVTDLIQRVHRAEYKRRQSSPGIRVSKKSFGTGRIYPIVQKWR